jgi:hypothetical protein
VADRARRRPRRGRRGPRNGQFCLPPPPSPPPPPAPARDAFSSAALLTAWALLYLVLGIWWWPAIPIALITGATALLKARQATGNLADLIEAAVDLHSHDLATALGQDHTGLVTPAAGRELTTWMRKSRWDPGSPLAD